MKKLLIYLLLVATLSAQTDSPPELDSTAVPDTLPELPAQNQTDDDSRLKINFVNASSFTEDELTDALARQIKTINEYGLDAAAAYDAAFYLEAFYRKHGYPDVLVDGRVSGPWELTLQVAEGPSTRLVETDFFGNTAFTDEQLREYLIAPTRERFSRLKEAIDLPFVQADIDAGAGLIRRLYLAEGYLDVEVAEPQINFSADKRQAAVVISISEGTRYTFGEVSFTGDVLYPISELTSLIYDNSHAIYTEGKVDAARRAITDYYVSRGYYSAEVDSKVGDARNAQIPVSFNIYSGPLYYFNGITFAGFTDVRESFMYQRMRHLPGTVYDPKAIDEVFSDVIQTGLFRNLQITPTPVHGSLIRLDVEVQEAPPKEFGIGLGYGSYVGALGSLSYRDLNFLRTGRTFNILVEVNQRGLNGEIGYRDRWLFESAYDLHSRLFALQVEMEGYSRQEGGFQTTLSRDITEHWKISALATARHVILDNILIEPRELVGPEKYNVISLGLSNAIDYRNNPAIPTQGFIFSSVLDVALPGVGDVAYLKGTARYSFFLPVTDRSHLAFGIRVGGITSIEGELPINEKLFNGGSESVRSFQELQLGPKDKNGYPIGGEAHSIFNVEYTFPIAGDLKGAVFLDAGNVTPKAADFGSDDMRYGVGAGLRYNLPVGAIRLDYGVNPDPRADEDFGAFHFAIGVVF